MRRGGKNRARLAMKLKWFQHLKFLATINTNFSTTKGYNTMNKESTSCETVEDGDEIATVKTPKKMRGEVEKKKMLVLDKAVGILTEHNKATEPKQLTEEDYFCMLVAKTLARLSGRNKLKMQKKISDVLVEAEIQATANQENGQFGFLICRTISSIEVESSTCLAFKKLFIDNLTVII